MTTARCPKCGGSMEPGFVLDVTRGTYSTQATWVEGSPEASIWGGLKIKGKRRIPVRALRCEGCGYLESYAASL